MIINKNKCVQITCGSLRRVNVNSIVNEGIRAILNLFMRFALFVLFMLFMFFMLFVLFVVFRLFMLFVVFVLFVTFVRVKSSCKKIK